jgi:hypothetical protein
MLRPPVYTSYEHLCIYTLASEPSTVLITEMRLTSNLGLPLTVQTYLYISMQESLDTPLFIF